MSPDCLRYRYRFVAIQCADHCWLATVAPIEVLNPTGTILVNLIEGSAQPRPTDGFVGRTEGCLLARLARTDLGRGRTHHDRGRDCVEGVELLVAIADLDTLGASKIDPVLARFCPGRVQQSHELLRRLDDGLVSTYVESSERLGQRGLPRLRVSGMLGQGNLCRAVTCELGADELLQLAVGRFDCVADLRYSR